MYKLYSLKNKISYMVEKFEETISTLSLNYYFIKYFY